MKELWCWQCGHDLSDVPRPISRHATCAACFNELHCCRLCRHYDSDNTTRCHEERADPPLQKENANFCDFFAPHRLTKEQIGANAKARQRSASEAGLAALFGDDEGTSDGEHTCTTPDNRDTESGSLDPDEVAKRKLDDLFK